jgi:hypothetical protein
MIVELERFSVVVGHSMPGDSPGSLAVSPVTAGSLSDVRNALKGLLDAVKARSDFIYLTFSQAEQLERLKRVASELHTKSYWLGGNTSSPSIEEVARNYRTDMSCAGALDVAEPEKRRLYQNMQDTLGFTWYRSWRELAAGLVASTAGVLPYRDRLCILVDPSDHPRTSDSIQLCRSEADTGFSTLCDSQNGWRPCGQEGRLFPFFVEPASVVTARKARPQQLEQDARRYEAAALSTTTALIEAKRRFSESWKSRMTELRPLAVSLRERVQVETQSLGQERARLSAERQALADLQNSINADQARDQSLTIALTNTRATLATGEAAVIALKQKANETSQSLQIAARSLNDMVVRTGSLSLSCGGANYSTCRDNAAKQSFNKAKYTAGSLVEGAMQDWFVEQDKLFAIYRNLNAKVAENVASRDALSGNLTELTALEINLAKKRDELVSRTKKYDQDKLLNDHYLADNTAATIASADFESSLESLSRE